MKVAGDKRLAIRSPDDDERELLQRLVNRDRNAWREFVIRYQAVVSARVRRTLSQRGSFARGVEPDDVIAEVFASLVANDFAALRQFKGKSRLSTWLSVIAYRCSLKMIAKEKNQSSLSENSVADEVSREPCVLAEMVRHEEKERLSRKLQKLNKDDREILLMFYREGLGYHEISCRFQISINTVGPKLHRAQNRLRELMKVQEEQ